MHFNTVYLQSATLVNDTPPYLDGEGEEEERSKGIKAQSNGGVVFTRWGLKDCPHGTQRLYSGGAKGSHYGLRGGGANLICVESPAYYIGDQQPVIWSRLFHTEYQNHGRIFGNNRHDYDVPCAVCYNTNKAVALMIPAKKNCPQHWRREYWGYLMTERYNHKRRVYDCIDIGTGTIPNSGADVNGALLYFVVSTCNGLPCPDYKDKRALTCVVCTR